MIVCPTLSLLKIFTFTCNVIISKFLSITEDKDFNHSFRARHGKCGFGGTEARAWLSCDSVFGFLLMAVVFGPDGLHLD